MVAPWVTAVGKAKNALGSSGKIPTKRMEAVLKDAVTAAKSFDGLGGLMEQMKKKVLEVQTANSKIVHELALASDEMDDEDFGLDPRKPEDKKKIDQAHKVLAKFIEAAKNDCDQNINGLRAFDRTMGDIAATIKKNG
jgi:hypothetical protein